MMLEQEKRFDAAGFLKTCTTAPGVYRMYDAGGILLYIGKAKNLRQRLSSYFRAHEVLTPKTRSLVAQIQDIQVTVTETEAEALLLEANLIKRHLPRYNILLRDDKSYPYLYLTGHAYPRLGIHRGGRRKGNRYFGPYTSTLAVRETLNHLQKIFRIRPCEDSVFHHRTRACLQYQIGRCTAPCVGHISAAEYAEEVTACARFLEGQSSEVIANLVQRMEAAAAALEFERAARLRDQITSLRQISAQQYVMGGERDLDLWALAREGAIAVVQIFFMRDGKNLGNVVRYPRISEEVGEATIMAALLAQYYASHPPPPEVLTSVGPERPQALEALLQVRRQGRRVRLAWSVRGERAGWMRLAQKNAETALRTLLASRAGQEARLEALAVALQLPQRPERIECFDISHTQGERTVASCVVMGPEGPLKADYRRFNIEGITPGDDYAAMHQALHRRFSRLQRGEGRCPDLLLIDGGKGQVAEAMAVLRACGFAELPVVGIAKGPERRPGLETLVLSGVSGPSILPAHSSALHLLQQIRDEAHRFALTGHRQRRAKARRESPLEDIPGLGPRRRAQLIRHFGGLQGIVRAGVEELAKVPGISLPMARTIYDSFHEE